MYFFLILFFVSLSGIVFMITRKLVYINHEEKHIHDHEVNFLAEILDWNKLKHTSVVGLKRLGHAFLWVVLRTYIISSNFLVKKTKLLISKIKEKIYKNKPSDGTEEFQEPSKYLKMISEYREKIKHLKHKIKQEEGIE